MDKEDELKWQRDNSVDSRDFHHFDGLLNKERAFKEQEFKEQRAQQEKSKRFLESRMPSSSSSSGGGASSSGNFVGEIIVSLLRIAWHGIVFMFSKSKAKDSPSPDRGLLADLFRPLPIIVFIVEWMLLSSTSLLAYAAPLFFITALIVSKTARVERMRAFISLAVVTGGYAILSVGFTNFIHGSFSTEGQIDNRLAMCLSQAKGKPQDIETGCYQAATTGWSNDLKNKIAYAQWRLRSKPTEAKNLKNNFNGWQASTDKKVENVWKHPSTGSTKLVAAKTRYNLVRSEAMEFGAYLRADTTPPGWTKGH